MFLAAARALEIWVVVRSSFLARRMKDGSNVRVVMMHHVNFLPPEDDGAGGEDERLL